MVASPERPLSTAAVFRRVDSGLTPRENSYTIYRFVSSDLEGDGDYSLLSNELETAALTEAPDLAGEVRRIRRVLVRRGARLVSLSGSGSSVFGLFDDARGARLAQQELREAGVPAQVSNSAGTYVCNHLMYGVLHYLAASGSPARAGFVHLPYSEAQVLDKPGVAALSVATMARGIEAAIAAAKRHPVDLQVSEGALD